MIFKTSNKVFMHLDCDSFFASCEILKNPSLKNKYVCVGKEIVIACTYNCKKLGVKTGTPVWQAYEMLKNKGIFLDIDHEYYSQVSRKLFDYLKKYSNNIEVFSIDEAFCDITGLPEYYKIDLEKYLINLQKNILKDLGVPVSIGCAETRIKAKIFSKINKPFGIFIGFDKDKEIDIFKKLELGKIPFIGRKLGERLKYKAKTIYDFIQIGFWELKQNIGKNVTDLRLELVGVNAFNSRSNSEVKSISQSRSFNKNITNDFDFLLSQLNIHFGVIFEDITQRNFEIKYVCLMLRKKDFETMYFGYHLPDYTNNRVDIYNVAKNLLIKNYNKDFLYRSVGIVFSDFKSYLPRQISIFDTPTKSSENNYNLYKTINKINSKYQVHKIGFGSELLGVGNHVKIKIMG